MKSKNVLIMAGGTGGHVIPALSVARQLKNKGYQIHWLGSIKGIENELVVDAGHQLHRISISGLRGNGILKLLMAPFQLLKALWQTFKVYREVKPLMALGMGGFASGPGGLMAKLLGVPLVVHEQNAIAGMTNKILSSRANILLQAFGNTFKPRSNLHAVGNPVRSSIVEIQDPEVRLKGRADKINVLVVGGSLGAVAINNVLIEGMASKALDINLWHQAGARNFDEVKQGYANAGVDSVKVSAFISNMSEAFAWADVLICRSGALTVSELMAAGVASILVPYPHAVDDHQTANGRILVDTGAAILIPQPLFSVENLSQELEQLSQDRSIILQMSKAARTLAKPDSAKVVANYCIEVIHDG
jgi:UDP-N-acetylglucosamine--N-acetylmuramyl-(pentapeptide) pyrophosphoryl-undecaprenol N-acetylglucosamine transferase